MISGFQDQQDSLLLFYTELHLHQRQGGNLLHDPGLAWEVFLVPVDLVYLQMTGMHRLQQH